MNLQSTYKEGRIALVLQAYKNGHFTSVRGTTDIYDIPKSTLQLYICGYPAKRNLRFATLKLIATEETTLL
jgi:hypothetical protein